MRAIDEVARLSRKIAEGEMDPNEPLFVLRAQDLCAADTVSEWCLLATAMGVPEAKVTEAADQARRMQAWPVKQVAGRPETRSVEGD